MFFSPNKTSADLFIVDKSQHRTCCVIVRRFDKNLPHEYFALTKVKVL